MLSIISTISRLNRGLVDLFITKPLLEKSLSKINYYLSLWYFERSSLQLRGCLLCPACPAGKNKSFYQHRRYGIVKVSSNVTSQCPCVPKLSTLGNTVQYCRECSVLRQDVISTDCIGFSVLYGGCLVMCGVFSTYCKGILFSALEDFQYCYVIPLNTQDDVQDCRGIPLVLWRGIATIQYYGGYSFFCIETTNTLVVMPKVLDFSPQY